MRSLQFLALFGATSLVRAQDFNFRLINDTPAPVYSIDKSAPSQVVNYDPPAAAASVVAAVQAGETPQVAKKLKKLKRTDGDCSPRPAGYGPVPTPDTKEAFLNSPEISAIAKGAPTPPGYSLAYQDMQASSNAYGFLGYITLETYDTKFCASQCTEKEGCQAINIFFERTPTKNVGVECSNPPSSSVIKCVFWGGAVNTDNAVNVGYTDVEFDIAQARSNGYNKDNVNQDITGYDGPTELPAAINAPLDCHDSFDTYMGVKIFTEGPFDPNLCAAACTTTSDWAREHPPAEGPIKTCQFFNTYILIKNANEYQGQYCVMYTRAWDESFATNPGQWRGDDYYSVQSSVSYGNTTESGQWCPPVQPSSSLVSSTVASSSTSAYTPPSTPSSTPAYTPSTTPVSTPKPGTSTTATRTSMLATKTSATPSSTACTCAASAKPYAKPTNNPICNKKGYNYLQAYFAKYSGSKSVPSEKICAWKCLQDSGCKSFAYNAASQTCIEYGQDVKSLGIWWQTWPFGGWASHDKNCFEYDCSKGSCGTYKPDKGLLPFLGKCSKDSQCACGRCLNFGSLGLCL